MTYVAAWNRWIKTSIMSWLHAQNQAQTTPYLEYIDGQDRKNPPITGPLVEFRVTGPEAQQFSANYWRLTAHVNVMITVPMVNDLWQLEEVCGNVASWLDQDIAVQKTGLMLGDNPSVIIGCLRVDYKSKNGINTFCYGVVDPKQRMQQASVDCRMWVDIEGPTGFVPPIPPPPQPTAFTVITKTSDYILQPADSGAVFTDTGAGSLVHFNLPPWQLGLYYYFDEDSLNLMQIVANGSDKIRLGGLLGSTMSSNVKGDNGMVVALSPGIWSADSNAGSWNIP